jgi:hypothetical protein
LIGARPQGQQRKAFMQSNSKVRKIAFVGDHLPRKCGIATFTSDLLTAVSSAHPQNQCLAVSVNTPIANWVSQQVGSTLDDVVSGGRLDVSFPSVERELPTPADYQRFQGKKARNKFEW